MGGVCPCFAGVEQAAAGKQPEKPKAAVELGAAAETQPLLEAPSEPKTLPKPAADAAPAAVAPAPVAPTADKTESTTAGNAAGEKSVLAAAEAEELGIGSCLEVYSNSYKEWCPGVVYGMDSTSILVAYQVPGEPADANISTKTLSTDSTELRMPTEDGSWLTASVEVYSHSNNAWCLGKVTENSGGVLSVVFFYPDEPPDAVPVMKQLPLGDKDLRLRGIDAAFQLPSAGLGHETLQVSSQVEVYSNSLGVWCPGVVQELKEGIATIAFYYPDMEPSKEDPAVKELPLGHQDLRVPGYATGATPHPGPPVTEADCVKDAQIDVFSQSRQVWISATIKEVNDGHVTLQLRYPDMPPDSELYEKVLPIGHPDMRLPANGNEEPK